MLPQFWDPWLQPTLHLHSTGLPRTSSFHMSCWFSEGKTGKARVLVCWNKGWLDYKQQNNSDALVSVKMEPGWLFPLCGIHTQEPRDWSTIQHVGCRRPPPSYMDYIQFSHQFQSTSWQSSRSEWLQHSNRGELMGRREWGKQEKYVPIPACSLHCRIRCTRGLHFVLRVLWKSAEGPLNKEPRSMTRRLRRRGKDSKLLHP